MSLKVPPYLAGSDHAYYRVDHAHHLTHLDDTDLGMFANIAHLFICQLGSGIGFALETPMRTAALFVSVERFVGTRAKPEMRRIDTPWVVALVAHTHTSRYRAVRLLPYKTVRPHHLAVMPESRIAIGIRRMACHIPASSSRLYLPC